MSDKNLYIIAGCNGAGKTTASFTILPEIIDCREFVNADEIARGLSPFQPEQVAFEAGRIMLSRMAELLANSKSFAFETTLSARHYKNTIGAAKEKGYRVTLLFFWLQSVELAKERVKIRVSEGGHDIKEDIIENRYRKGIQNLFDIYLSVVDEALIFDNSFGMPELLAESTKGGIIIVNENRFAELRNYYDTKGRTY
ncbi:zeta toxin family protein [Desertivirga brevis]|uniref:zeta toxin family protein n=1 Tax=Desertivirga brevis TaxID=2810310 RepID=UPI001A96D981